LPRESFFLSGVNSIGMAQTNAIHRGMGRPP
jgi:hypothetical protein